VDALALGLGLAVVLLFVKELGLPIPVPGDLIVLGAGAALARDGGVPLAGAALVIAATIAGGAVQFLLVRGAGRRLVLRILRRVGVGEARVEALATRLRQRGATGVAVARATPGVRIVAIAAAGLAALPFLRFLMGLAVGNTLFVGGHLALGYALGPAATEIAARVGSLGLVLVGGILILGAIGYLGWRQIRRRRPAGGTGTDDIANEATGDWTDAACPACLALGAIALRTGRVAGAPLGPG
jgi:membrane protein DedA with SNARE-associated domain